MTILFRHKESGLIIDNHFFDDNARVFFHEGPVSLIQDEIYEPFVTSYSFNDILDCDDFEVINPDLTFNENELKTLLNNLAYSLDNGKLAYKLQQMIDNGKIIKQHSPNII